MSEVLVHICCGVCASSVIEKLRDEKFDIKGFFYNPNICPPDEYERRLKVAREVSKILCFDLIEGSYDKNGWVKLTAGLENEPEGGKRCEECFRMRLEETYRKSKELDMSFFTTTLTVSPHKNASVINKIGKLLNGSGFSAYDFKKEDGFKRAIEFAKKHNLYRQHYCGCIYSRSHNI